VYVVTGNERDHVWILFGCGSCRHAATVQHGFRMVPDLLVLNRPVVALQGSNSASRRQETRCRGSAVSGQ
jgi:hypothetical protein